MRAANDLDHARSGVDLADAQPISVGMWLGFKDLGNDEGFQLFTKVHEVLDLEADGGQSVSQFLAGRRSFQVVLEPGERELHGDRPPAKVGTSSGRKP